MIPKRSIRAISSADVLEVRSLRVDMLSLVMRRDCLDQRMGRLVELLLKVVARRVGKGATYALVL